ncbi:protein POLR1D isoform X1 [Notamacropus eugenii]|uniref:protein POLR1D isoform X1 n=2 Tax=Notamacropus eugenii TaxID=9315 RepID=UPI003B671E2B
MQTLSLAPDAADKASWDSHPGLSACISERSLGRAPHEEGGGRGGDSWGWAGGGLGEGILAHSRIGALWGGGSPEAGAEYPPRCPAAGNRNSNEPCLWRRGKDPARKAIEELLKEAKRGKTRAETMGPMGWMKCPLAGTNKRFLLNTLKNTLPSQKEQDQEQKGDKKEAEPSQNRKEENSKKHRTHPYKHNFQSRRRVSYSPPRKRNPQEKYEKQSNKR